MSFSDARLGPTVLMGLLLLLAVVFTSGCAGMFSPSQESETAESAPSFEVSRLQLESGDLETDIEFFTDFDKPVYAMFFTTSCPSCVTAVEDLYDSAREWEKQGVQVVIISGDSADDTAEFFNERELFYEVYVDQAGEGFSEAEVRFVPTGLLVDEENQVVTRITGWTEDHKHELESAVEQLLE